MSFHVGQKVVCIATFPECEWYDCPNGNAQKGETYVISGLTHGDDGLGLELVGLPCYALDPRLTDGWHSSYFRPLEELQQESRDRYYATHHITITLPA